MRRTALALALLCCAAAASPTSTAAQSPLERRVTVHVRDVALRDALDHVAAAGEFRLSYSSDNLPLDRRVTVWRDTTPVGEVLLELLRGFPVTPVVAAMDQIVLAPRVPEASDSTASPVTVLDRVVVTGSVSGTAERSVPVALDVIRGRDMERRGQSTLSTIFDGSVPGVWMWEQAPGAMLARYGSIRGASSFSTSYPKVYVDGIEVANPLLLTQLTPELVERVEVIRGPQGAALYGTDAISGVVNVISRHDVGATGESRVLLRSEGGYAAAYGASAVPVQQHSLSTRVGSNLRSAGLSVGAATSGAYIPEAYSRELRFTGDARAVGTMSTLTATARFYGKNAGVPMSPLLVPVDRIRSDSTPQELRMYMIGSSMSVVPNETWTYTITGGVDGYALSNVTSEWSTIPFSVDSALRDAGGSALRATMRATAVAHLGTPERFGANVTFAAEHSTLRDRTLREIVSSSGSGGGGSSGPGSGAGGDVVEWSSNMGYTSQIDFVWRNSAFITAGVRQERVGRQLVPSQFETLPMLGGALVREFGGITAKARMAYGRGIRTPSTSLRARMGEAKHRVANPVLAPEEQSGVEGGVDLLFGTRLGLHLTRFDQLAFNLIQTVAIAVDTTPAGEAKYLHQSQNVGEISNRGWEAQASAAVGRMSLTGALTTVDSRVRRLAVGYKGDMRAGDRMLGVPARTLSGTVAWARSGLQLSTTVARASDWINYDRLRIAQCYVNGCADKRNLTGQTLRNYWSQYDGSTRVRAAVAFDVRRDLTFTVTGENLLNQQRGEPDSITIVPGRTITAGIRARF